MVESGRRSRGGRRVGCLLPTRRPPAALLLVLPGAVWLASIAKLAGALRRGTDAPAGPRLVVVRS
jgi:hypothetical protein